MSAPSSWLAGLPAHWLRRSLGRECWVRARLGWKGLKAEEYVDSGGYPMLATPDIKGSQIEFAAAARISEARFAESPEIMLRRGDVLLTKDGSTIGTLNLVRQLPEPATVNGSIAVLTPSRRLHGPFLYYVLASRYAAAVFRYLTDGAGVPHLFQRDINKIAIPMPPLDEQRRIADFLDAETAQIDALIAEQERFIALLRERRLGVIEHEIGAADAPRTSLKRMLSGVDQGVSPQADAYLADDAESWGVLKSGCVNNGVFRQTEHKRLADDFEINQRYVVRVGDLIVNRASGSPDLVGSAGLVDRLDYNLILSDKLFRLIPLPSTDVRFLKWALNSVTYREQVLHSISGAEGLANNLPLSALRSFQLPLPEFAEQRRISNYLDRATASIDALIREAEHNIALSKERRASLITAAVTGQIDVTTGRAA